MSLPIIILAILVMAGLGFMNIRSLVRKWKANPGSWFDLLIGIILWIVALGLVSFSLIKNYS